MPLLGCVRGHRQQKPHVLQTSVVPSWPLPARVCKETTGDVARKSCLQLTPCVRSGEEYTHTHTHPPSYYTHRYGADSMKAFLQGLDERHGIHRIVVASLKPKLAWLSSHVRARINAKPESLVNPCSPAPDLTGNHCSNSPRPRSAVPKLHLLKLSSLQKSLLDSDVRSFRNRGRCKAVLQLEDAR